MNAHRRRLRTLGVLATIGCTALGATACGSSSSSDSGSGGDGKGDAPPPAAATSTTVPTVQVKGNKKVVLVTCEPNVFCHAYNINLTKKLRASGVKVSQLSDNFDPALQNKHMNQAIAQKPDAIVLFASNADAIVPSLRRAKKAGVPVVNVDAPLKADGQKLVAFNAVADNPALGKFAAQNLVEGMKKAGHKKGNIISITGTMGTLIVQDRIDAFEKEMAKTPEYKIVATQDGNWDQVKTSQIAQQLLTKYRSKGGIQGAYGMADYQAAGIIQAADQLGIPAGIKNGPQSLVVTGSNCTPTGYPLLASGKLYGDATQSPIHESNTAYTNLAAFLNGKKVPKNVIDESARITIDNYKDFEGLCSKWPK